MKVTFKLFAQYREGRFKIETKEYEKGITIEEIMSQLSIGDEFPLGILMVNGKHESICYQPKEGDEIALFPKIGGG